MSGIFLKSFLFEYLFLELEFWISIFGFYFWIGFSDLVLFVDLLDTYLGNVPKMKKVLF